MKRVFLKVLVVISSVFIWGCQESTDYCPDKTPYFHCHFSNLGENNFDTFMVIIDGLTDTLFNPDATGSQLNDTVFAGSLPPDSLFIPLKVDRTDITFRCMFNDTTGDICKIFYNTNILFSSPECGFFAMHSVDCVIFTTNVIDSAYMISQFINDNQYQNLEVFY